MNETFSLLQDLIRIPSVNGKVPGGHGEEAVAGFLAQWLAKRGIESRLEPVRNGAVNLVAEIPGRDRERRVLLCSHLDTVAVGPMRDPFGGSMDGDWVHGRGACDAKASVAVMAAVLARGAKRRPRCNLVLAAVGDEEQGGYGAREFVEGDRRFDEAVVGEPTECRMVVAHRGSVRIDVHLQGQAAHSSVPEKGANALVAAAALVSHLAAWSSQPPVATHPLIGGPLLTPTLLRSGVGSNVVPPEAWLTLDRRTVPPEDWREAAEAVRKAAEQVRLPSGILLAWETTFPCRWLDTSPQSEVATRLASALEGAGLSGAATGATYGTDASHLAEAGIPTVVFGPGSIAVAHGPEERVALGQLAIAERALSAFVA